MSDPNPRPSNPPPPLRPDDPPPADPPRKSASPLIWILLLIALIAFAWYFYNQRATVTAPAEPATPPAAEIGSEQEAAAEREREATAAREARPRETQQRRAPADREPSPLARIEPDYPPSALRAREEGSVLVRAEIDAQGNPTNVGIAKRSGSRDLDRAAVNAVRKWKFEPAMKGGKAVASTVQVPVEFTLDEQ